MKKILIFVGVLAAMMTLNIGICSADNIDLSKMKIKWSDEFNGNSLNMNNWSYEIGNGNWGWGNNEKEYYTDRPDNLFVSGGVLNIKALYEENYKDSGFNYTSARIKTANKVTVGNGYVVAKIKVPAIRGIWPAFWMLGTNGGWPDCGEIDILETWNTNNFVQSTIHYSQIPGKDKYEYAQRFNIDKTQWHTYGVYRNDTKLRFYVDNELLREYDITGDTKAELRDNYYILLNMACGGNLPGNIVPSAAQLPATMQVDYVRHYVDKTPQELASENGQGDNKTEPTTKKPVVKSTIGKSKIIKIKNIKKRKIALKLKKIKGAKGYVIRYCDNKKFQGYTSKKTSKRSVILKRLNKKSTYYVKARAYKKANGKKIYGKWSKVKRVKIRK